MGIKKDKNSLKAKKLREVIKQEKIQNPRNTDKTRQRYTERTKERSHYRENSRCRNKEKMGEDLKT